MTKRMTKRQGARGTQAVQTQYRGPIRLSTQDGLDTRTYRVNLTWSDTLVSDIGGTLSGYINGSDVAASSDWTAVADLYRDFRVLGIEVRWVPFYNGSYQASLAHGAGAIATVRAAQSAAPVNLDSVIQIATWKPMKTSAPATIHWKMNGIEEAGFSLTSSPSDQNRGGMVWYIDNLTASQAYGTVYYTFLVEARGRK